MVAQTGDATTQGEDATQAQGAAADTQDDAQGANDASGEESVEALRVRIAELQKDNFSYRERERKREQQAKQDKAKLSESEALSARVADLERQLTDRDRRAQEQSLRLASITAAQRRGFRNPDLAYRLLDIKRVEFDDDGDAVNVDALLGEVATSDPYLLVATDFGGGKRGDTAAQGEDMNALIRRSAAGRT